MSHAKPTVEEREEARQEVLRRARLAEAAAKKAVRDAQAEERRKVRETRKAAELAARRAAAAEARKNGTITAGSRENRRRQASAERDGKAPETFEGTALKQFEENDEVAEWIARAREIAIDLSMELGEITINDVRERIAPPEGRDGRIMGAVFRTNKSTAARGAWHRMMKSLDSSRARGRPLCVFVWKPAREAAPAA